MGLCITFRQVAVYFVEKHFTANLVLRGSLSSQGTALGPAVRNDLPELAEAIDRAVAGLSTEDLARLTLKWLPRTVVQPTPGSVAPLTQAQREWIQKRGSVRLGFDSAFSPSVSRALPAASKAWQQTSRASSPRKPG